MNAARDTTGDLFAPASDPAPPPPRFPAGTPRRADVVKTFKPGKSARPKPPPAPLVRVDPYPCDVADCRAHGTYGLDAARWCAAHLPATYWGRA
jgi:hypothetical protein